MIDLLSWILLVIGSVLGLTGAIGLFRFPDFYSRVHAASISDTLCAACFVFGLMLQSGLTLISAKLFIVLALLWITCPTATHALVKAAHSSGLRAVLSDEDDRDAKKGGESSNF